MVLCRRRKCGKGLVGLFGWVGLFGLSLLYSVSVVLDLAFDDGEEARPIGGFVALEVEKDFDDCGVGVVEIGASALGSVLAVSAEGKQGEGATEESGVESVLGDCACVGNHWVAGLRSGRC